MKGRIVKGVGGLYTVYADGQYYSCKARGIFRKDGIVPLPGDVVAFDEDSAQGYVLTAIYERNNSMVRPAVANIDLLFIIVSTTDPLPNHYVIDKTIAIAEFKRIEPIVVITKTDLSDFSQLLSVYGQVGIRVLITNPLTGEGLDEIKTCISGKVCCFTGNSGVGKSTLLNRLFTDLKLPTSETSTKLGRGKHTTRHVEMFYRNGGFVADTPGFSAVDIEQYDLIFKEELPDCFREFSEYIGKCRFTGCSHTSEKGCAILEAVKEGKIAESRHADYVRMYNEVKNLKEWELQKNGKR